MRKLMDRYIFFEVLIPFGLILSALMMILLTEQMVRLTELLINQGVSFATVLKIFVYLLPAFLVIAIPMGVLIAVIIGFSRLTADHEITAFTAGGVGPLRLAAPVYFFAALAFGLTFSLSVWAQPWVGRSMKTAALDLAKQEFSFGLTPGLFNEPLENMMIYVDEMPSPAQLKGIVIYDLRDAREPTLTLAREGAILSDPASNFVGLRLLNGSQHRDTDEASRHQWITFGRYEFKLDLAAAVQHASRNDDAAGRVEQAKARFAASEKLEPRELRMLEEYYKTYAFPFSCLIFGALGVPLGRVIKHGGRLGGFALGIATVLFYYLFMIVGDFLVASRMMSPLSAAWLPNLLMAALALRLTTGSNRGFWSRRFRPGGR